MPGAAAAAIVTAIGVKGVAAVILHFVISAVISVALGALASVLFKKKIPDAPDFSAQARDRTITVRQPTAPWTIVPGEMGKLGGIYALIDKPTGDFLHLVIVLAGREVDAIGDIWFDDEIVPLDGSGNATGKFVGFVRVKKHLGSTTQTADSDLVSEVTKWTTDHRLRGKAYIYVRLKKSEDLFPNGVPNITATVRGHKVFDPRDGGMTQSDSSTWKWSPNPALIVSDYLTETDYGLGADYATEIGNTALISAANSCEEMVTVSFSKTFTAVAATDLVTLPAAFSGMTTGAKIKLSTTGTLPAPLVVGTEYFWIRVTGSTGKFAASETDAINGTAINLTDAGTGTHTLVRETTTVVTADAATDELTPTDEDLFYRGDGVQLTTTGTLPAGLATSTTYYVIPGPTKTIKLATTLANAIAGTAIDLTTTGSGTHTLVRKEEVRYQANGSFKTSANPDDVLRDMFSAMAGRPNLQGVTWIIKAGVYEAPTITLAEDDLRDGIKVTTRIRRRDLFNAIKGVYVSPANNWQPADIPVVTNATYKTQDNNERIWADEDLAYTISPSMAQRILKIKLEQGRQQIACSYPTNLGALRLTAGDTVKIDNTRFGWTAKVFEIPEWHFNVAEDDEGTALLTVDLALRETASSVYDWNAGEEVAADPAPDTNLPDPFTVAAPTALVVQSGTAQLDLRLDGTVFSRMKVSWTAPADPYVTAGGFIQVRYKKSADATWIYWPRVEGARTFLFILDVKDGVSYDVEARSINQLGVRSDADADDPWAASVTNHTVIGKTALASDPTGFSAQQNATVVVFKWNANADVDHAGTDIRYGPRGLSNFADATPATEVTKGTQITTAVVPPGDWTFYIKHRDTSGNFSAVAATFNLVVTNTNDVIKNVQHDPDFSGTLVNMLRHWTGKLVLDDQDSASGNDFGVFDNYVQNPYPTGSYEATEIDLGFDADAVRVFADVTSVLGPGETTGKADPQHQISFRDG